MRILPKNSGNRSRWPVLGLFAVAAAAAALSIMNSTPAESRAAAESGAAHAVAGAQVGAPSFADVIERVRPSVVTITVTQVSRPMPTASRSDQRRAPSPFDDFFDRFFGGPGGPGFPQQPPQRSRGLGSGFIVGADGYIATNYHVVENAESVKVTLDSGDELDAVVVGHDPQTDIALVKVQAPKLLPALEFGDSDSARVGDWVVAIGNPFGLGGTATAGIISARGRDIHSGPYDDYLQIDAPINSGNSGGPVFNAAGQVIGINTAIFSPNGGNIGIGFAIPSNQAVQVLDELKADGTVSRGWLGVQIQPLDAGLAATFGLDHASGALVAEIVPGSPADRAGLEPGDVVTEFAGHAVDSPRSLARAVGAAQAGEHVALQVWRDGHSRSVDVVLGQLGNDGDVVANSAAPSRDDAAGTFGLTLEDLTPRTRSELGLEPGTEGAVIVDVMPGSSAAAQGIRPGDVIVSVDRKPTDSASDAANELAASNGEHALVMIRRGEEKRFVALKRAA